MSTRSCKKLPSIRSGFTEIDFKNIKKYYIFLSQQKKRNSLSWRQIFRRWKTVKYNLSSGSQETISKTVLRGSVQSEILVLLSIQNSHFLSKGPMEGKERTRVCSLTISSFQDHLQLPSLSLILLQSMRFKS